jgi:hypothetical protein
VKAKIQTKKAMGRIVMLRLRDREFEQLHAVAVRQEVAMSEIVRDALRTKLMSEQAEEPRPAA